MIHIKEPISLHDIVQASIDGRGVKPVPLSMKPGDAPMRAVPIVIVIRDGLGQQFMMHPRSMTLVPHVKFSDGEQMTAYAEGVPQQVRPAGDEKQAYLSFVISVPPGYVLAKKSEMSYIQSSGKTEPSPSLIVIDEIVHPEQNELTPEQVAVAATREINGLPSSVNPDVFAMNPDAINRFFAELKSKPAIPDAGTKE